MSHKIDVFSTATSFGEEDVRHKIVVVIDVLRATSSIITGLHAGAKAVVPVEDMGDAGKMASRLDPSQYLLCGEKDGKKIDGYHLGNSPLEYKPAVVKDKTLIFNTTNGTKALSRSVSAKALYVASFLNASAIINELRGSEEEIILVCAGWKNRLSLEDMLCAGLIVYALSDGKLNPGARDGAKIAFSVYERCKDQITETVQKTNHAMRLREFIEPGEIEYCCKIDSIPVIPVFVDGVIVLK